LGAPVKGWALTLPLKRSSNITVDGRVKIRSSINAIDDYEVHENNRSRNIPSIKGIISIKEEEGETKTRMKCLTIYFFTGTLILLILDIIFRGT